MAKLATAAAFVEAMEVGNAPVLRAWLGNRLVHVRPPRPVINFFRYTPRGDSALLAWDASSTTPILSQSITRRNPDGATDTTDYGPATRMVNTGEAGVGQTTWDLTVTNAEGSTTRRLVQTVNGAPSVHVSFAGFRQATPPSNTTAQFDVTWVAGWPLPASTLTLTGPGHLGILNLDQFVQRGQTSHRVVVVRGGGAGGTTTLRVTMSNAAGTVAASATSGSW